MKPKLNLSRINGNRLPISLVVSMSVVANTALMADEPPVTIAPEISLTAPVSIRAVAGTSLQPLSFTANNLVGGAETSFSLALSASSVGTIHSLGQPDAAVIPGGVRITTTPFTNVSLLAGNVGTISATPDITGVTAGQSSTFGLTATNANWNAPVTSNSTIHVVSNRLLTGSTTINAGRHVTGAQLGSISLSGGALTDSQASRISINGGGYAQLANGLRLTAPGNFTFNGAGQSSNLNVAYNGQVGNYSINSATLPSANSYTHTSGNVLHQFGGDAPTPNERINPLISGETIQGSSLNLSGVSLTVTGTAVANRLLTGSATINAGRHMAGLQSIGSITLSGGAATDSEATRISVSSGGVAQLANGLRLTSTSDFTFNGANQTHDLQISYNRPTGAYNISGASLPGANTYTDASGNQRQEFGGAWKTSAQYGNLFGEKRTFTEDSRSSWDALPGNDRNWQRPGTGGSSSGDYIYNQEIATTGQPGFPNTRNLQVGALNTAWELQRGAGALVNERINPLISGEVIQGSSLNLSGVTFNITGTAVTDRSISGGQIDLGRRMQGSGNQTINRTDNITLTTFGSDDHRTRLSLAEFALNANGVTATHTGTSAFAASNHTAAVQVTGNFTIDTSVAGRVTNGINAGSFISSGEDPGFVGQNTQSSLQLGYTWNNVQNNELFARDLLIIDSNTTGGTRSYSTYAGQVHSTETHTNIGVAGNNVQVTGTRSTGIHNLGNRTVTAIAEGLVGENATASATFNTRYASVAAATFTATNTGAATGPLTDGNTITIRDTGLTVFQNNVAITGLALSGGQNLEYQLIYGGGSSLIEHGGTRTFTIDYTGNSAPVQAGQLGRIARADLSISLEGYVNYSGILTASGISGNYSTDSRVYGDFLGTQNYQLETRFDAPASTTGSLVVAAGTDLGVNGLALKNTSTNTSTRFVKATDLEILDSNALGSSTNVQVEFVALTSAAPALINALENSSSNAASLAGIYGSDVGTEFVSDIVNLTGLDGVMQVVQLGYDASGAIGEDGAQLLWRYDYTGEGGSAQVAWINAVLGNSNITDLDLTLGTLSLTGTGPLSIQDYLEGTRFEGSYDEYLVENNLTNPQLGTWGFDLDADKVWAVIDHNSSFAVSVPEPSSSFLVLLGVACLTLRRKKN